MTQVGLWKSRHWNMRADNQFWWVRFETGQEEVPFFSRTDEAPLEGVQAEECKPDDFGHSDTITLN